MAAAATAAAATTDSSSDSHSKEEAATSYLPSPSTRLPDAHDTVLTACSLETTCCVTPPPDGYSGAGVDCAVLAVCGTYQLVKGPEGTGSALDTRKGSLRLYELLGDRGEGGGGEAAPQLVERQVLELAAEGVLDCKWRPSSCQPHARGEAPLLACATSQGRVATYTLTRRSAEGGGGCALAPGASSGGEEGGYMALALEWSRDGTTVASSNNDGTACLHRLGEGGSGGLEETARWAAHDLGGSPIEVWTTAFADRGGNLLLTGADDCRLKAWDLRCLDPFHPTPVWTDGRSHTAGVTSLQAFGGKGEEESWYFASGSYDGVLRLWDRRKALRPVLVHERDVGGGVWRIKWRQPDDAAAVAAGGAGGLLALACMHGGAAVWRLDGDGDGVGALEEVASYRGHQSMAYGIDWCECRGLAAGGQEDESTRRQLLLASCSFYDHALHLWAAGGEGR